MTLSPEPDSKVFRNTLLAYELQRSRILAILDFLVVAAPVPLSRGFTEARPLPMTHIRSK